MSWMYRSGVASLVALSVLFASLGAPASATTRIFSLYGDALFGPANSFEAMRNRMMDRRPRLVEAAALAGLNRRERSAMLRRIAAGDVTWTTIPQRLDSMTWYRAGSVRIFRDVVIPANVWGWEVDVPSERGNLRVFFPDSCGNLSVIRTPLMTWRGTRTVRWTKYVYVPPPPLQASPSITAQLPQVQAFMPEAPAVPQVLAATYSRRGGFFPWWLLPILIFIPHGGSTPVTPSTPPTPTPPPSFYQCWEGPVPLCDSATQARKGPSRPKISIRISIPIF